MNELQWHSAIRQYVFSIAGLNLLWEIIQLPLYTLWRSGSTQDIIFAVLHCTAGDIVIAITALLFGVITIGRHDWPKQRYLPVSMLVIVFGLIYTIYSERINIASGVWAYSELMPVIPWLNVGLAPFLQWILMPAYSFWRLQRPSSPTSV